MDKVTVNINKGIGEIILRLKSIMCDAPAIIAERNDLIKGHTWKKRKVLTDFNRIDRTVTYTVEYRGCSDLEMHALIYRSRQKGEMYE